MNSRLAKTIRKEARKRFRTDMDDFTNVVMDLPAWQRVRFCFWILFGFLWGKKGGDI